MDHVGSMVVDHIDDKRKMFNKKIDLIGDQMKLRTQLMNKWIIGLGSLIESPASIMAIQSVIKVL